MKKFIMFILLINLFIFTQEKAYAFQDVHPNTYYAEAITHLSNKGIINGYSDGNFYPKTNVTRGQAAKIIARTLNFTATNNSLIFEDVPKNHEFVPYIAALAERKIIKGYNNGLYGMNDTMTREQVASVLVKSFELPIASQITTPFTDINNSFAKAEIETLYAYGITTGVSPSQFGSKQPISRGDIAVLIHKLETLKENKAYTVTYKDLNAKSVDIEYLNTPTVVVANNDSSNKRLTFIPTKTGRDSIVIHITTETGEKKFIQYHFENKELNNRIVSNVTSSTEKNVANFDFAHSEFQFTPKSVSVKRANGTVTKTVDIQKFNSHFELTFYAAGQFIATFEDGINVQNVIIQISDKGMNLVGEAIFEQSTLTLSNELLGYSLKNAKIRLLEDSTRTEPISYNLNNEKLIINAISEGSIMLEITANQSVYTYIIEVKKLYDFTTIDVYETY